MPPPRKTEISVAEARMQVLGRIEPLPAETVTLLDALDRVLAEDVAAARDVPPWDNSAMDGFALIAAEVKEGASFEVIEAVMAGGIATRSVAKGQAIRIMTGAPMPKGADCVLPIELAEEEGRSRVKVKTGKLPMKLPAQGEHLRRAGEDIRKGEVVLRKGDLLTPVALGVAASLGRAKLAVHRRPRVAVLATGDELVEAGTEPGPGQIVASTSTVLRAALSRLGAEPVYLGSPVTPART